MTLEYLNTKHAVVKLLAMTLAIISALTTTLIYYYSPWSYNGIQEMCRLSQEANQEFFEIPLVHDLLIIKIAVQNCPGLYLERIAVCIHWICLVLSVSSIIGCCASSWDSISEVKVRDALLHVIIGAAILVAQISWIVSAVESAKNDCTVTNKKTGAVVPNSGFCAEYLNIDKKYIASVFGFLQALVFVVGGGYIESTQVRWAEPAHLHSHRSTSEDRLVVASGELSSHRMSIAPHSKPTGAPQRTGRLPPRSNQGKSVGRAGVPSRGAALNAAKKGISTATTNAHTNMPANTSVKFIVS